MNALVLAKGCTSFKLEVDLRVMDEGFRGTKILEGKLTKQCKILYNVH